MTRNRFNWWCNFHRKNPHAFELFKRFALEALAAGRDKFGAYAIGERMRWYTNVETVSDDEFKISNTCMPYYARLLAGTDERFVDFFNYRPGKFDSSVQEIVEFHNSLTLEAVA
jgi:hypothetical protein